MVRLLFCLLTGLLLFGAETAKKLSADEIKAAIANADRLFLLDVRDPKELAELGTLKGATNIPLDQMETRLAEIPKDGKILVFCNHGVRAGKAAEALQRNGYENIIGLGAMAEWKEKKYDVVYPKK